MPILNFDRDKNPTRVSRLLSFGGSPNPKRNIVFGAIALVALAGLGSTLAANINLNSGSPVEFGQGIAQTTACDSSVAITPFATFINASGGGNFALQSITVSGIDSSEGACLGKDFTIKAFGDSSDTELPMVTNVTSVTVADDGTTFTIPTTEGVALTQTGTTSFTLTFDPTRSPIATTSVYKFTLESSDHTEAVAVVYAVGDPGPGGGTIFYYWPAGFNCGESFTATGSPTGGLCHYLEAAPTTGTNAWTDATYPWSGDLTSDVATNTEIGTGYANTIAMVTDNSDAGNAGTICRAYRGPNSFSDWFLPSKDELNELQMARASVGGFVNDYYESSSEGDVYFVIWFQDFQNGVQFGNNWGKVGYLDSYYVRPVRAF